MSDVQPTHTFCLIVGTGMSGITVASHLLKLKVLNHDEFRLVSQEANYGGVWETNQYPGAACDVPSHGYVMRWFLKPGKILICNKIVGLRLASDSS